MVGVGTLISIDVGIKNFAYCVLNDETKEIIRWECFSLCNGTELENCKDLIEKLDERNLLTDEIKFILIELQPFNNVKMRLIAESVRTYFLIRLLDQKKEKEVEIMNWSAKYKLQCYKGEVTEDFSYLKSKYSQRKRLAIYHCTHLLEETNQTEETKSIYTGSKKKDDLADCYLQGLSYLLFPEKSKPKPKPKKARVVKIK